MSKLDQKQLEELKQAFSHLDANKDGFISKEELKGLLGQLGDEVPEEVVNEMMTMADTDNDGKVNFEEFCKAVQSD